MKPLLTEKDVAARGWPQFAIEQFLGEPDSITNGRRYHNAQKVVAAEARAGSGRCDSTEQTDHAGGTA